MAHIKDLRQRKAGYTGEKPYLARYRDPFGKERSRTFRTRRDARNWLNEQEVAKSRGDWVDPSAGRRRRHSTRPVTSTRRCSSATASL